MTVKLIGSRDFSILTMGADYGKRGARVHNRVLGTEPRSAGQMDRCGSGGLVDSFPSIFTQKRDQKLMI